MSTYDEYIRHFEMYGPEGVLEIAMKDKRGVTARELADLKSHMGFIDRTHDLKNGVYVKKPDLTEEQLHEKARKCLQCGLELPRSRAAQARFHDGACKQKWYRKQKKARKAMEAKKANSKKAARA